MSSQNAAVAFVAVLVFMAQMAIGYFGVFDTDDGAVIDAAENEQGAQICKLAKVQGKYLTCSGE